MSYIYEVIIVLQEAFPGKYMYVASYIPLTVRELFPF